MDFEFNEQQQMFQESFRAFLEDKYDLPRHASSMQDRRFDDILWRQLADLGLFSMLVPEQFDGLGLTTVDIALVLEELGKALIGSPVTDTIVATDLISRYGTEAQKAKLLPRIATGDLRIVTAIAEPESGFGLDHLTTQAVPAGDGWRLQGCKILVPGTSAADLVMVAARVGTNGRLGLALIEPQRPGISVRDHLTLDPTCPMSQLSFSAVAVRADEWLGSSAACPNGVERLLDAFGMVAALQMIGIAGKVLELSVAYAAQRVQFGKPIGSFQAIKHKCADMAVAIDAGRSAAYFAAWAVAEGPAECPKAVSMAKSFCGDAVRMVCNEGIQIHGGMGFTWEVGLHYYLRRAKLLEYSYGDAAFHRERVLAASLSELGLAG